MDFKAFTERHYAALSGDEVRHNVLLAILKRGQNDPDLAVRTWNLGQPGCCAVQQHGYGIVLGDVDREAAEMLAREVDGENIRSVMGPDDTARWFVEAARGLGIDYPNVMAQTIHVLDHQPKPPNCDGKVRL
ncbi:MAG: hypothetical protein ACR2PA_15750, partial [Hyphomicrobiaceae bacterium]